MDRYCLMWDELKRKVKKDLEFYRSDQCSMNEMLAGVGGCLDTLKAMEEIENKYLGEKEKRGENL